MASLVGVDAEHLCAWCACVFKAPLGRTHTCNMFCSPECRLERRRETNALDDATSPSPTTPLGAVLSAALGREELEAGRPISTTRLAILAGVSPQYVRKLVSSGELVASESEVKAKEAKRWLTARGVQV
jgi:hypothetical protein